jgi:hypothetical protein
MDHKKREHSGFNAGPLKEMSNKTSATYSVSELSVQSQINYLRRRFGLAASRAELISGLAFSGGSAAL